MSRPDEAAGWGSNESGAALPLHSPHELLDLQKAIRSGIRKLLDEGR